MSKKTRIYLVFTFIFMFFAFLATSPATARDCSELKGRALYFKNEHLPDYNGCQGYIVTFPPQNALLTLENPAWSAVLTDKSVVPHKTEVIILEQQLTPTTSRSGYAIGTFKVREVDSDHEFEIPSQFFEVLPYWALPPEQAVHRGPFIGLYVGTGLPPVDRGGRPVAIPEQTRILIEGQAGLNGAWSGRDLGGKLILLDKKGNRIVQELKLDSKSVKIVY